MIKIFSEIEDDSRENEENNDVSIEDEDLEKHLTYDERNLLARANFGDVHVPEGILVIVSALDFHIPIHQ